MISTLLVHNMIICFSESVPAKVLLQLSSVFEEGGLRDRNGTFQYNDHLCQTNVPILAIAGDQDPICPPEAVYGMISKYNTRAPCLPL